MEYKKLKEIAEVNMGQSPKSEFYSDTEGVPFLQGSKTFKSLFPIVDMYTTKVTKLARKGDILFSVRAPVGDMNIAPLDLCIGRGLAAIRARNGKQHFLYYLLKNNIKAIDSTVTGTVFSSINKKSLEEIKLPIPDPVQQELIGSTLWSIDQKIELNKGIISNLEILSQTLFKNWFIDFEFPDSEGNPYKSSGGKMIESELGEIPEEWAVKKLQDISEFINGYTFKSSSYEKDGNYKIVTIKNVEDGFMNNSNFNLVKELPRNINKKQILYETDILISLTGNVGRVCLVSEDGLLLNQRVGKIIPMEPAFKGFLYTLLRNQDTKNRIVSLAKGSVQQNLGTRDLKDMRIIVPKVDHVTVFNDLYSMAFQLIKENQDLSKLRDILLPKLLSGEIELSQDGEVTVREPV